jgi:hypothetical protein
MKNMTEANESLTSQINRTLSERTPSVAPNRPILPHPLPRASRRDSIVSIRSDSSPDTHITLVSSDDGEGSQQGFESSDVEFISDSENAHRDPMPKFREIKLKPVKTPAAFFQLAPQASTSKAASAPKPSVQKRKLVTPTDVPGLELRNGKTMRLVATGPKRSKRG